MNPRVLDIAKTRRADLIRQMNAQKADLQADINCGTLNRDGMQDAYLAARAEILKREAERIEGGIAELESLKDEAMCQRLVPEAYETQEPNLIDTFKRGGAVSALPWGA